MVPAEALDTLFAVVRTDQGNVMKIAVVIAAPSRTQGANGFVAWLNARPQFSNDGAIDALFGYAAESYPCKR
jgi:hypothetical protein